MVLKDHPSIKSLTEYFLSKANPNPAFHSVLQDALAPSSNNHVGLILSERLVNMPVQIVPPMYRMLADEIKWGVEEVSIPFGQMWRQLIHRQNEPFDFKYYLIVTRTYHLSSEELDDLEQNSDRTKRRKGQISANETPRFFHPEDGQFQQVSRFFYFGTLSFRARGVGIVALHSLSVHECAIERGRCLRTRHSRLLNVGARGSAPQSHIGHPRSLSPFLGGNLYIRMKTIQNDVQRPTDTFQNRNRLYLELIPIFKLAPTTSTSFHLDPLAACFLFWMCARVFLKCLVIISGVCTPSRRPGGARCDGWTSGDEILSMLDVISSTKLFTNFGVT